MNRFSMASFRTRDSAALAVPAPHRAELADAAEAAGLTARVPGLTAKTAVETARVPGLTAKTAGLPMEAAVRTTGAPGGPTRAAGLPTKVPGLTTGAPSVTSRGELGGMTMSHYLGLLGAALCAFAGAAAGQCVEWGTISTAAPGVVPRLGFKLAYDPLRDRVVLAEGSEPRNSFTQYCPQVDTWEFDGAHWEHRFNAAYGGRPEACVAFAPSAGGILRAGGKVWTDCDFTDLTCGTTGLWQWTGSAWTQIGTVPIGDRRIGATLVANPFGAGIIMFGGHDECNFVPGNRTVRYDGGWTLLDSVGPPHMGSAPPDDWSYGRTSSAMCFDEERGKLLLLGGYFSDDCCPNFGTHDDVHAWNGSSWQLEKAETGAGVTFSGLGIAFAAVYFPPPESVLVTRASGRLVRYVPTVGYEDLPVHPSGETLWGSATPMVYDSARERLVCYLGYLGITATLSAGPSAGRIGSQPSAVSTFVGGTASFSVSASGQDLLFQWYRSGVPLTNGFTSGGSLVSGATSADLLIAGVAASDAGLYRCTVSNACGQKTSAPAGLTVRACASDVDDDGSFPDAVPDGGVDINDLLYFLAAFEAGDLAGDLDDGNGQGVPDGGVDINDLLFFLTRFETGC